MRKVLAVGVLVSALQIGAPALAASVFPGQSAGWFNQIRLTSAVENQANKGEGVVIGIVDTGIIANHFEFSGRVSGQSTCAATSFVCSSGFVDDNGHGTATAAIAAGAFDTVHQFSMSGVAPAATIISEKVLGASGSGTAADVANGIIRATNSGAKVINLSLTYIPTTDVINAIDYAAKENVVVVFAGGNDSAAFDGGAITKGLTRAALSRIIFAGSVDSNNVLSSFSNTPGTGSALVRGVKNPYAALWLMAPGERIVAPGIQYGPSAYAYWSGTSMAAPEVAGAIALLEATWPVLVRNGTATSVLFSSAHDLGAPGTDATYGNGLLDLTAAFQPIGGLTVTQSNGKAVPLNNAPALVVTASGGALGRLSSVQGVLSAYTSFDSFQRDFKANLSGLIASTPTGGGALSATVGPPLLQAGARFEGGAVFVASSARSDYAGDVLAAMGRPGFNGRGGSAPEPVTYIAFRSDAGSTVALGRGLPSGFSFAEALWGPQSAAADPAGRLGVSGALLDLAQGGTFAAAGLPIGSRSRLAFTWSTSRDPAEASVFDTPLQPRSSAMAVGLSTRVTDRWTVAATYGDLGESYGLLGALYQPAGLIELGSRHRSWSAGFSSAYDFGGGLGLLVDATRVETDAAQDTGGLVTNISALRARAYGVSLAQSDAFAEGDRLSLSIRKPLRVYSGEARMVVTSVDSEGYPHQSFTDVSLRPDGDETDIYLGYATVLNANMSVNTALGYRSDAENTRGLNDFAGRLAFNIRY